MRSHGVWKVPLGPCCIRCGSTESLVRHHPDYEQPLWVLTLCQSCHQLIHRIYRGV
jgi:hypothetical protein